MKGEAGVLQQRIEVISIKRRRYQPQKRVGGEQHERQKCDTDHRLNRQNARAQGWRQVAPECGDKRAKQRKNQYPEQKRAFVIAPDTCEFIEKRLG